MMDDILDGIDDEEISLVIAEEVGREMGRNIDDDGEGEDEDEENLLVLNEEGLTKSNEFYVFGDDFEGNITRLPIENEGVLDSFVVISDDPDFRVTVEIDDFNAVDDKSFSDIKTISAELSHISAYTKNDGSNVLSVIDYPFSERLGIKVYPVDEITFDLVRTEVILGGDLESEPSDPEIAHLLQ